MACKLVAVSGMAFEAAIARATDIHTVYGLNSATLENQIEAAIHDGASALLSFGVAAGLAPELSSGTIIIARRVLHQNHTWEADALWSARLCATLPGMHYADILGVDQPLATVEQKSMARTIPSPTGGGIAIADMESHRVARLAAQHKLPFAAIRVVLDAADRALPPAALAATRSNGTVDYVKLLHSLLIQPRQLPQLLQLAADNYEAKKSLLRCGKLLRGRLFLMHVG